MCVGCIWCAEGRAGKQHQCLRLGNILYLCVILCYFLKKHKIICISNVGALSLCQQLLLRAVNKCLGLHHSNAGLQGFGLSHTTPKHSQHTFISLSAKMLPNGRWVMPLRAACCPFGWGKLCPWWMVSSNGRLVGGWGTHPHSWVSAQNRKTNHSVLRRKSLTEMCPNHRQERHGTTNINKG